ncbi:XIAP-associated factor 1 isoform X6 [Symphalangus syndactylus]|uniref:XIAP-associated factor 1 isoform X6 n=1 Tax=Symphalangus syndactylus TaxID=9590 RepID=UPI0030049F56
MEGDFSVCRNCKTHVASAHFALHEAYCLQLLVLCPECEEPVPRENMEEHRKVEHQQANECQERPVECKFCELDMQLSKLELHESNCGSRTEPCPGCGQFIMHRMLAQHTDVCRSEQAQLGKGLSSSGYSNSKPCLRVAFQCVCCGLQMTGPGRPGGRGYSLATTKGKEFQLLKWKSTVIIATK